MNLLGECVHPILDEGLREEGGLLSESDEDLHDVPYQASICIPYPFLQAK